MFNTWFLSRLSSSFYSYLISYKVNCANDLTRTQSEVTTRSTIYVAQATLKSVLSWLEARPDAELRSTFSVLPSDVLCGFRNTLSFPLSAHLRFVFILKAQRSHPSVQRANRPQYSISKFQPEVERKETGWLNQKSFQVLSTHSSFVAKWWVLRSSSEYLWVLRTILHFATKLLRKAFEDPQEMTVCFRPGWLADYLLRDNELISLILLQVFFYKM